MPVENAVEMKLQRRLRKCLFCFWIQESKMLKVCVVKNKFCWEKYWTLKVLSKCLANIIKINGENSGHSSHSLTSRNIQNSPENVCWSTLVLCLTICKLFVCLSHCFGALGMVHVAHCKWYLNEWDVQQ